MDGPPYELTQIEPFSRDPTRRLRWKPKGVQKARLKHELHGHHEEESYPENDRDSHQEPTLMDRYYKVLRTNHGKGAINQHRTADTLDFTLSPSN